MIKKILLITSAAFLLLLCAGAAVLSVYNNNPPEFANSIYGVHNLEVYQNDCRIAEPDRADYGYDVKAVYRGWDNTRLVDYANGYYLDVPNKSQTVGFDFKSSKYFVKILRRDMVITISRETSPYPDVAAYIENYNNRFVVHPEFQAANNITRHEDITRKIDGRYVRIISITRTPAPGSEETLNTYSYIYIMDKDRDYYRLMLKSEKYDVAELEKIITSFTIIPRTGRTATNFSYTPGIQSWSEETKALYTDLSSRDEVLWGAFTSRLLTDRGMDVGITELEEKLEYQFRLVMGYCYLEEGPPIQGMLEAHDAGKVTELTLQLSTNHNENLYGKNINFDVLDGLYDNDFRDFARKLRDFGHPFLFRLNNEMNTDWTSYSGMVTLADPDIYVKIVQRIKRIFDQEGVNNAIWIFNPQYGDYPPSGWNVFHAYYPGDDAVQLLGVTGYNTGDYYKDVTGEEWRGFNEIYGSIDALYKNDFSKFAWIITEFASSSYGGDKAEWINEMFASIGKYPRIKAAVWFNHADADYRPEYKGNIARPYWLDETPETLEAFKAGVNKW